MLWSSLLTSYYPVTPSYTKNIEICFQYGTIYDATIYDATIYYATIYYGTIYYDTIYYSTIYYAAIYDATIYYCDINIGPNSLNILCLI